MITMADKERNEELDMDKLPSVEEIIDNVFVNTIYINHVMTTTSSYTSRTLKVDDDLAKKVSASESDINKTKNSAAPTGNTSQTSKTLPNRFSRKVEEMNKVEHVHRIKEITTKPISYRHKTNTLQTKKYPTPPQITSQHLTPHSMNKGDIECITITDSDPERKSTRYQQLPSVDAQQLRFLVTPSNISNPQNTIYPQQGKYIPSAQKPSQRVAFPSVHKGDCTHFTGTVQQRGTNTCRPYASADFGITTIKSISSPSKTTTFQITRQSTPNQNISRHVSPSSMIKDNLYDINETGSPQVPSRQAPPSIKKRKFQDINVTCPSLQSELTICHQPPPSEAPSFNFCIAGHIISIPSKTITLQQRGHGFSIEIPSQHIPPSSGNNENIQLFNVTGPALQGVSPTCPQTSFNYAPNYNCSIAPNIISVESKAATLQQTKQGPYIQLASQQIPPSPVGKVNMQDVNKIRRVLQWDSTSCRQTPSAGAAFLNFTNTENIISNPRKRIKLDQTNHAISIQGPNLQIPTSSPYKRKLQDINVTDSIVQGDSSAYEQTASTDAAQLKFTNKQSNISNPRKRIKLDQGNHAIPSQGPTQQIPASPMNKHNLQDIIVTAPSLQRGATRSNQSPSSTAPQLNFGNTKSNISNPGKSIKLQQTQHAISTQIPSQQIPPSPINKDILQGMKVIGPVNQEISTRYQQTPLTESEQSQSGISSSNIPNSHKTITLQPTKSPPSPQTPSERIPSPILDEEDLDFILNSDIGLNWDLALCSNNASTDTQESQFVSNEFWETEFFDILPELKGNLFFD